MTLVGVTIPTVPGREAMLARCLDALDTSTPKGMYSVWVATGYDACGAAWNDGAMHWRLRGATHLLMLADDLTARAGWLDYALDATDIDHVTPAFAVWTGATGALESIGGCWHQHVLPGTPTPMTGIPFVRTEDWEDIPPIMYYSDNAVGSIQRARGRPCVACPGAAFDHWWSPEGRKPMGGPEWDSDRETWERLHLSLGLTFP